ncbi:MAG: coproporphyrinogen III oxidase-like Fe-S oxidoreductase, partial [Psychromonas sp.]
MLKLPPLSLYIHIPWCIEKCPYCDFNSHKLRGEVPEQEYLHALLEDLSNDVVYVQGRVLETIFIGGGTPSLLSASGIGWLLTEIEKKIPFKENIEITLEANP